MYAFIRNEIDSISHICVSEFTKEDITRAKNLLLDSIPTTLLSNNKDKEELDEILTILFAPKGIKNLMKF